MEESFTIPAEERGDELDPRIQVELEKLNAATDEINKLETELDESNTTFRLLLGEASRRIQGLAKRLGSCVERSRPYYDAVGAAAAARTECQKAAVQFQRASELHAAAKEAVRQAERRFESKHDEWQFDSAWQEVLNHAIIKVMDAERRKADSGREHQRKAGVFYAAERKVAQLEDSLKRHIIKSRLYFEEKTLCEEQLKTQREKVESLQKSISDAKGRYAKSLKALEVISEEIHRQRGEYVPCGDLPVGPREPGVGAEHAPAHEEVAPPSVKYDLEEPSTSATEAKISDDEDSSLQRLRLRVRELALKPMEGEEMESDEVWALELNETINKLDHLLMMKENNQQKRTKFTSSSADATATRIPDFPNSEPQNVPNRWKSEISLNRQRDVPKTGKPTSKELSRSMMSLDVVSLARDTSIADRESYLRAIIEDKSPSGTYTGSASDRDEAPEDILSVECDSDSSPVITMRSTVDKLN